MIFKCFINLNWGIKKKHDRRIYPYCPSLFGNVITLLTEVSDFHIHNCCANLNFSTKTKYSQYKDGCKGVHLYFNIFTVTKSHTNCWQWIDLQKSATENSPQKMYYLFLFGKHLIKNYSIQLLAFCKNSSIYSISESFKRFTISLRSNRVFERQCGWCRCFL